MKLIMCSDISGHWVDVQRSDITGNENVQSSNALPITTIQPVDIIVLLMFLGF